jgi:AraC-like DNA-binding protein
MNAVSQSDDHQRGLLIGSSRRELASSTADALSRFNPLGEGSFRVASPSQDVIAGRLEHRGVQQAQLQFQSEGWCGFSYCLYGRCDVGCSSGLTQYCTDTPVIYNGGLQIVALLKGSSLLSVGLSGTPTALADFLGLTAEDLSQIIDRGAARLGDFATGFAATAEQVRRSAMRLAQGLSHDQSGRFALLRVKASAMDFGLYMLESMDRSGARNERVHRVSVRRRVDEIAAYLEKNPSSTESISSIAARMGFSRSAFDQAFRAQFGCSPGTFRIDSRLRKVARALQSTDTPIIALAMDSGFSSSSNLTRCFRTRYGLTPMAYRSQLRAPVSATRRRPAKE